MPNTIFIQIAAYRDPQLVPTIRDCLAQAEHPENLVFCIAWQHAENDMLEEFANHPQVKVIDIDYRKSKGACWARNQIQQRYDGETYTLQLDSHHRFAKNWDTTCIQMMDQLKGMGHAKPLLTGYVIANHSEVINISGRIQELVSASHSEITGNVSRINENISFNESSVSFKTVPTSQSEIVSVSEFTREGIHTPVQELLSIQDTIQRTLTASRNVTETTNIQDSQIVQIQTENKESIFVADSSISSKEVNAHVSDLLNIITSEIIRTETGFTEENIVNDAVDAIVIPKFFYVKIKVGNEWKESYTSYIKINNTWKEVEDIFTVVDGKWQRSWKQ